MCTLYVCVCAICVLCEHAHVCVFFVSLYCMHMSVCVSMRTCLHSAYIHVHVSVVHRYTWCLLSTCICIRLCRVQHCIYVCVCVYGCVYVSELCGVRGGFTWCIGDYRTGARHHAHSVGLHASVDPCCHPPHQPPPSVSVQATPYQ